MGTEVFDVRYMNENSIYWKGRSRFRINTNTHPSPNYNIMDDIINMKTKKNIDMTFHKDCIIYETWKLVYKISRLTI